MFPFHSWFLVSYRLLWELCIPKTWGQSQNKHVKHVRCCKKMKTEDPRQLLHIPLSFFSLFYLCVFFSFYLLVYVYVFLHWLNVVRMYSLFALRLLKILAWIPCIEMRPPGYKKKEIPTIERRREKTRILKRMRAVDAVHCNMSSMRQHMIAS